MPVVQCSWFRAPAVGSSARAFLHDDAETNRLVFSALLRRERGHDLVEARVPAQEIELGVELKKTVGRTTWERRRPLQDLDCAIRFPDLGVDMRETNQHQGAIVRVHR